MTIMPEAKQNEPLSVQRASSTAHERYKPVVQALVDAFAERLEMVVLFGSQARGEAGPESDHDLCVVIEGLPADPLLRQRAVRGVLLPILDRLPGPISFLAKTPRKWPLI